MKLGGLFGAGALFAATQLAAYGVFYAGPLAEIDRGREREAKLKQDYAVAKNRAVNLDLYRKQFEEIDKRLDNAARDLPGNWPDPDFGEVRRLALAQGLRVETLNPDASENLREFHATRGARLEVRGPFHRVGAFVAAMATLPGSPALGPFSIERSSTAGAVSLAGTVRTFRYVDHAEQAERRKAAAARGSAK